MKNNEDTRQCRACGEVRPVSEFYRRPSANGPRWMGRCKSCISGANRARYEDEKLTKAVEIHWPDGEVTTWGVGHPTLGAEGVGQVSASDLGAVAGMLTAAGLLLPIGLSRRRFTATRPQEQVFAALAATLEHLARLTGQASGRA